jgi:hypothetical protein
MQVSVVSSARTELQHSQLALFADGEEFTLPALSLPTSIQRSEQKGKDGRSDPLPGAA